MEFIKPKRIFIVDDDTTLTEAMSEYLTRKVAHKVSTFRTGEECLKRISEEPDIVILDFHLNTPDKPAEDGMEILKTIKKHYPGIHVIMVSSLERYGLALQTIQKGAEQYVIKGDDAFEKVARIVNDFE